MVNLSPPIREPTANLKEAKNSNFEIFYKYKDKESHLIFLIREY